MSLFKNIYRNIPVIKELHYIKNVLTETLIEDLTQSVIRSSPDRKKLELFEFQMFSQHGEDGIICEIFNRIGIKNKTFVEIGVGDGYENNTTFLLLQGWKGHWIECDARSIKKINKNFKNPLIKCDLQLITSVVNVDNINGIFQNHAIPEEFDLLSLDIDRNTYWAWKALSAYKPRAVVVEYNASIGPSTDWVIPYEDRHWDGSLIYGASLKALEKLGAVMGYILAGCDLSGSNCFFVRNDLCKDLFEQPSVSEHLYQPPRLYLQRKFYYKKKFNQ